MAALFNGVLQRSWVGYSPWDVWLSSVTQWSAADDLRISSAADQWLMITTHTWCNCKQQVTQFQGHNHVFKVGGPIPWSRVLGLLSFYRKKLDRSTQFGAVGYIITLYSSKSYVKSWRSVQILGRSGPPPPDPQWLRPWFSVRPAQPRNLVGTGNK